MKILKRATCEWEDVTFNLKNRKLIDKVENTLYDSDIFAVKDDERNKYVLCKNCGELILYTEQEIKKHQEKASSSEHCLSCGLLRRRNVKMEDENYTLNSDGTYTYNTRQSCELVCTNNYSSKEINTADARKGCRYVNCAQKGVEKQFHFFAKYPDAFDYLATVDAFGDAWSFVEYFSRFCMYKANKKYYLAAYVNNKGIIYKFKTTYRGNDFEFVYSKKYDKIFWCQCGTYEEKSNYSISDIRMKELMMMMHNIYNIEENKDDKE